MAKASKLTDAEQVADFMAALEHPHKTEFEALRRIILNVDARLQERIKWKVPSFFYKLDLAAFHPRSLDCAHLIIVYPSGTAIEEIPGLLLGKHVDRREAKFYSMDDVGAKRPALERVVQNWLELVDRYTSS